MCFAPQRRALFWHRNFQKWSDAEVFCTFCLGNVLRATTACTFSTSQLPKVIRDRQFLTLLTSKCASRHNGVHFFIAPVASWLRTRRFSEPTFRPSGATNHWKNTVFRDFPTFSRICIFCLLTLSLLIFSLLIFLFSLPLPCSAFHLSILSEVWLLNFLRQLHYTNCITPHYTTQHTTPHYTTLRYTNCITLHYTTLHTQLHYTTLPYPTLHYITLHYTTVITPSQMQLQLHYTNYTTPQLQLHYTTTTTTAALHHTTCSSCGWGDRPGDHCNHCSHSKNTAPTTFWSISGFALPSVIHNNQSLL